MKKAYELLFSLVKNNFFLLFTVPAHMVVREMMQSTECQSWRNKKHLPTAVAEGSLPNLITAFVNLPPCSASKQSQHQIRPCRLLQRCSRQFHSNVNVPIPLYIQANAHRKNVGKQPGCFQFCLSDGQKTKVYITIKL